MTVDRWTTYEPDAGETRMITERSCRACDGPLDTVLNLGTLALSDFPLPDETPKGYVPFDFCSCRSCGLVQLRHTVDPDQLFRQYWYKSSVNETMRAELKDVVAQAVACIGTLNPNDIVVDVGANDGELLKAYGKGVEKVAFEPALNLHDALLPHCDLLISDYFPKGIEYICPMNGHVKVLTSIACFYASDDPRVFVQAVDRLLHPDGVWVVQFQDLHQMIQATAFDNITPEHLFYPSLAAIERLLGGSDLHVTHAEVRPINGGSYRLHIQRTSKTVRPTVASIRALEAGCESWQTLQKFAWRVGEMTKQIRALVLWLKQEGRVVDLYGASTKANTLIQVCGLGPDLIRQAWERTPEKYGLRTVTGIPIVSEADGRANPPDAAVVGIWQFRDQILKREAEYLDGGGSLIFPLPHCDIVTRKESHASA